MSLNLEELKQAMLNSEVEPMSSKKGGVNYLKFQPGVYKCCFIPFVHEGKPMIFVRKVSYFGHKDSVTTPENPNCPVEAKFGGEDKRPSVQYMFAVWLPDQEEVAVVSFSEKWWEQLMGILSDTDQLEEGILGGRIIKVERKGTDMNNTNYSFVTGKMAEIPDDIEVPDLKAMLIKQQLKSAEAASA